MWGLKHLRRSRKYLAALPVSILLEVLSVISFNCLRLPPQVLHIALHFISSWREKESNLRSLYELRFIGCDKKMAENFRRRLIHALTPNPLTSNLIKN
jgi:hypothetical protein